MLDEEGLSLRLLAEDLGFLDAGVKNLIKLAGLPGMDIWQFNAWDMMEMCREEPDKARMRAFYTGTHDNDTLMGFLIGDKDDPEDVGEALDAITKIYESPACLAMMQLQDVFLLGREARMNVPGVPEGNWTWKVPAGSLEEAFPDADERAAWLRALAERTGRL
jgi:4-alpha-glucanotransferase